MIVPTLETEKYVLHFFPDRITLTDGECKHELCAFKLSEQTKKDLIDWLGEI